MMKSNLLALILASILLFATTLVSAAAPAGHATLNLVESGKPACAILVLGDQQSQPLLRLAAKVVGETVQKWTGVALESQTMNAGDTPLPAKPTIVFATLDSLKKMTTDELPSRDALAQVATLDEQGFAFIPFTNKGEKQLFVVSHTPRGVYNGAFYFRDFCLDGTRENLLAEFQAVVRSPKFTGRPVYTLTIWGNEQLYTAKDWAAVFPSFARDGIDRVYFWVSGHFPSKKFSQSYKCEDRFDGKLFDTTTDSRIGTVEDLKEIIASAHAQGLKIYLGGGLGGWCGTQFLTNLEPETIKTGPKEPSLCPSHPKSRQALFDYYQELATALPDADGLFIESADEIGACLCSQCNRSIDQLGSKHFGQAQLTLCQEIMESIWRDHPQARFAYTIGYPEHTNDVAYYDLIKRMSADPRFEWMESRNSWTFPGADGVARPPNHFSKQVMRWREFYKVSLDEFIADANRGEQVGMNGLVATFSPGYASGSFYKTIPFPTDLLPYVLSGFVYREATWNPALTAADMRARVQRGFFGKEAPAVLGDDLWKLREIIRTKSNLQQLPEIEQHVDQARAAASPKTEQTLDIMQRAIDDIRSYLVKKNR